MISIRKLLIVCLILAGLGTSGAFSVTYYFMRNKVLAHMHLCAPDDNIKIQSFGWWPRAISVGMYLANPGGAVHLPPNYQKRLETPTIVKGDTSMVFDGPAQLEATAAITIQQNGSIVCPPAADMPNKGFASCVIREADNANLPALVDMVGINGVLSNVTVEGNREHNPHGGVNILVTGLRSRLDHVSAMYAPTDGIQVGYPGATPTAQASKLDHIMSGMSGRDGLYLTNTADVFVGDESEFENSGQDGIQIQDAGTLRMSHIDVGGNHRFGISDACVIGNRGAAGILVLATQFGGNAGGDIHIDGAAGTSSQNNLVAPPGQCKSTRGNVIIGNQFISSSGSQTRPGTADAISISDSGNNAITGNVIISPNGAVPYRTGIRLASLHSQETPDTVTGNLINGTMSAPCLLAPTTYATGNANCNDQRPRR